MATGFFGTLLAFLLLVLYGAALVSIWRVPFRALGVLVAGMALHNFLLMALLSLATPEWLVRVVQSWKEGILLLLLALAVHHTWRVYSTGEGKPAERWAQMWIRMRQRLVAFDW